jgi:hypothetical protein
MARRIDLEPMERLSLENVELKLQRVNEQLAQLTDVRGNMHRDLVAKYKLDATKVKVAIDFSHLMVEEDEPAPAPAAPTGKKHKNN